MVGVGHVFQNLAVLGAGRHGPHGCRGTAQTRPPGRVSDRDDRHLAACLRRSTSIGSKSSATTISSARRITRCSSFSMDEAGACPVLDRHEDAASISMVACISGALPFALLGFDGLDIVGKARYALHVMYTKGIEDWSALDEVSASGLDPRMGRPARLRRVVEGPVRAEVLRISPNSCPLPGYGTRIKRVRPVPQESHAGTDGLSRGRLSPHSARDRAIHSRSWRPHHPPQGRHRSRCYA